MLIISLRLAAGSYNPGEPAKGASTNKAVRANIKARTRIAVRAIYCARTIGRVRAIYPAGTKT
jgi:hypothetical protein